jgi:hypothetical protein
VDAGTIADNISRVLSNINNTSFLGWGFAVLVYMLPTILAAAVGNRPRRVLVIGVLNLLLGWTGLGWFALIGWAIIGRPKPSEEDAETVPYVHTPGTG